MKCDEIYSSVLNSTGGGNYSLFDLAQCFIDGYDPEKLRQMLVSEDAGVVSDGLFVLGEIGNLANNYVADIERLTHNADAEIRRKAVALGAIYIRSVPPSGA